MKSFVNAILLFSVYGVCCVYGEEAPTATPTATPTVIPKENILCVEIDNMPVIEYSSCPKIADGEVYRCTEVFHPYHPLNRRSIGIKQALDVMLYISQEEYDALVEKAEKYNSLLEENEVLKNKLNALQDQMADREVISEAVDRLSDAVLSIKSYTPTIRVELAPFNILGVTYPQ